MSTIISVVNKKGGCGKTTTSINLTAAFAAVGYRAHLVDADPSLGSASWYSVGRSSAAYQFQVSTFGQDSFDAQLRALVRSNQYEVIVVDCPNSVDEPHNEVWFRSLIKASNAFLIPVMPSGTDARATAWLLRFLREATKVNEVARSLVFMNNMHPTAKSDRELAQMIRDALAGQPVTMLKSVITSRTIVKATSIIGSSVLYSEPKGQATAEYIELMKEIQQCLNASTSQQASAV